MAGGRPKFRHLSRNSAHRQALLRNLLDQVLERESITTTWAKAKEAQKLVEKVITMGKENTVESRRKAESLLFRPQLLPKIFGELRTRYSTRPGGYTRVLKIESPKEDAAPSAILSLVDGPRDMRFALVARTLAHRMRNKLPLNDLTRLNVRKVTRFRGEQGTEELKELTEKFGALGEFGGERPRRKAVYPDPMRPFPREQRANRVRDIEKNAPWWNA